MESLYDKDFYEWTQENANLLREGRFAEIDIDNLVEELEAMGRSEKRAFETRIAVLIAHLLKWQWQPERHGKSWEYTIREQRVRVADILRDNPSLKHYLDELLPRAYEKAILTFVKETGLQEKILPVACPYSFDEIMSKEFFPEKE